MSSFIRIYEKNETKFNHNGLKTLHPTSCKINRNLVDYTYELDMEHPIDDSGVWQEIIEERIIMANNQYFRIVHTDISVLDNTLIVYAKHIFFDLQNNFIEDADVIAKNGNTALGQLLSSTVYQHNFSSYSDTDRVRNFRCVRKNVLDALLGENDSFIAHWGGELDIDGFNISFREQVGEDKGYTISYGKNLTGLTVKTDYTEIATYIRPVGFDEIELPDDDKYVKSAHATDYAMPIIKEYKYENVKWTGSPNYEEKEDDTATVFNTLEEAQNELRRLANLEFTNGEVDLPKITCEINFIELSQTEEYKDIKFLETVSLGDIVTVYHRPLGINIKSRCISYTYDCLLDKYEEITIGSYQKNFFKETTKNNEKLENNDFDITSELQSAYVQTISKMTDMMNHAMNGYVVLSNSEILIMDSPDKLEAKNVWKFNSSGIAHSSTGYYGEYTVGMTMDGHINGALITAGTIKGDMLEASTITTRELAVEIQTTIATAMTEEKTQAMITANLNTFESDLSKTYITKDEASKQIQEATEVAVEQATQEVVNTSVERAMASVNDQLDNKLSDYTTGTLHPALQETMSETLQDSKDYTIEVIGGYYTKEETDSKILQTRDEIELSISNTYETKENTTVKIEGAIGNAIEEMSIGAVNRVLGSKTEKSVSFLGLYNQNWYPYDVSSDISDKEVTISFKFDLNASVGTDSQLLFQPRYLNSLNEAIYSPSRKILSFLEPQEVTLTNQQVSFVLKYTDVKQDFKFGFRADGIEGTLTVRKAQIKEGNKITEWSIAPEDIENNAQEYTIEQLKNYYTKEQTTSAINASKDEINLFVSETYETKAEVLAKIDDIQVGGTNLVINSDFYEGKRTNWLYGGTWLIHTTEKYKDKYIIHSLRTDLTSDNWMELRSNKIAVQEGETITMSVDVKWQDIPSGESSTIAIWGYNNNEANRQTIKQKTIDGSQDWHRLVLTGTVPTGVTNVRVCITHRRNGGIYATNFKLEKGNKATDWSPASEDIVGNAQKYTVEQLENYYTKEQTKSQINILKDEISLNISSLNETTSQMKTDIENTLKESKQYSDEGISNLNNSFKQTITNYYTKEQTDSAISASKDEINLSISQTYETKAEVDTKINEIQIGGANLILNSDFSNDRNKWACTNEWVIHTTEKYKDKNVICISRADLTADAWSELSSNKIAVKEGLTLTMAVDIKWQDIPDGEGGAIAIWGYDSNNGNRKSLKQKTIKGSQDWDRIVLIGTVPEGVAYVRASITHRRNGAIYATNFKLETGNKPTDWSPAPDDIITEVKNFTTIEADKALTESKEYTDELIFNYYDKEETLAQINIAKESIESTVKNSYVSKGEIDGMVIGGDNLIPNSNFAFQLQNWSLHTPPNVDDSTSSVTIVKDGAYVDEAVNTLQIRATNLVDRYGVSTETLDLSANTEYVLSGYCAGLRVESLQTNIRDAENNLVNISTQDYLPVVGKDLSDYHYFIHKFKTVDSTKYRINLYGKNFGEDGYAWFTNIKLQQGNTPTAWTGCPEDYRMYAHQTMSQVSFELADLSQIVADNTGSDSITSAMKVKLMSEYNDAIKLYNRLNSTYSTFGDTSFGGLLLELTTAKDELISAVAPLEESISTASKSGLNNILIKFNNFYSLAEELTLAIQNSLAGLAKETKTQVTQLADSYNISVSRVEHIGQQVDELTTHFNFTSDGLVIKSDENATKTVKLDNDSLDFLDNNTVVAQITDKRLLIRDAEVENELKIGSFKIKPSGTGGIMFIHE